MTAAAPTAVPETAWSPGTVQVATGFSGAAGHQYAGHRVDSFDLTVILSALAEPGRRALMTELYRGSEPIDCAVVVEKAGLGLSNPTISHHYRVLREAGLIRTVAEGRKWIVTVRRDDMQARFPGLLDAVLST